MAAVDSIGSGGPGVSDRSGRRLVRVRCFASAGAVPWLAVAAIGLLVPRAAHAEGPPQWDDARDDWGVELQVGPTLVADGRAGAERAIIDGGGVVSVGFRRRLEFEKGNPDDVPTFLAVPTLGLALLPPSGVYGTEMGLDLRLEGRASGPGSVRWIVAIDPIFRVSPQDSRFRFPALVQMVSPTIGVIFDQPSETDAFVGSKTRIYVAPRLIPIDILLQEDIGLEIDSYFPLTIDPKDASVSFGAALSLKLLLRSVDD